MNLSEQDARALQALHFYWDQTNQEFYRDWGLFGNDYMKIHFDRASKEWIFLSWDESAEYGSYEHFKSLSELFKYFGYE